MYNKRFVKALATQLSHSVDGPRIDPEHLPANLLARVEACRGRTYIEKIQLTGRSERALFAAETVPRGQYLAVYFTIRPGHAKYDECLPYALGGGLRGVPPDLLADMLAPVGGGPIANDAGIQLAKDNKLRRTTPYDPAKNNAVLYSDIYTLADGRALELHILESLVRIRKHQEITWAYGPGYWVSYLATHHYRHRGITHAHVLVVRKSADLYEQRTRGRIAFEPECRQLQSSGKSAKGLAARCDKLVASRLARINEDSGDDEEEDSEE